ncbi:hypothetical protein GALMADRAFT_151459 [Galerina marginata CBS 339.88]|uniref:Uncharacterized protein n=1 Tax=Galerina marginata (strain CBS 339.88) TaxID=685588 RepID=A0A067TN68_GALM3|nr:hypothetical protein GALMADRAFT_151459 [Galerina marginata CBS 339.88]
MHHANTGPTKYLFGIRQVDPSSKRLASHPAQRFSNPLSSYVPSACRPPTGTSTAVAFVNAVPQTGSKHCQPTATHQDDLHVMTNFTRYHISSLKSIRTIGSIALTNHRLMIFTSIHNDLMSPSTPSQVPAPDDRLVDLAVLNLAVHLTSSFVTWQRTRSMDDYDAQPAASKFRLPHGTSSRRKSSRRDLGGWSWEDG